ncbi:MAG: precorrin-6y C5,15-methyltransferase (decarboxylating) subunit CbiE, partial [Desulfamplus sp.]|nr:precorrin-6y C5,15-methyltransferase (decarboxylating) subunit CbiE [Desulfamplus sp.]
MGTIDVIGFGLSVDDLTEKHKRVIAQADILVGGRRHIDNFKDIPCEKIAITKDIQEVVSKIKEYAGQGRRVVVLASGDPLFHGIGSTLVKALGKESINIYPNISSVAAAFAAIKEPWHDAQLVSLHGNQNISRFASTLDEFRSLNNEKKLTIAILTDQIKSPAWVAQYISEEKIAGLRMYVFENLGSDHQKITLYDDMAVAAKKIFSNPNIVILKQ